MTSHRQARLLLVFSLIAAFGCGEDEAESTILVPEPPAVDEAPLNSDLDREHSGQPIEVGGHDLEVLVHESGQVYVYPQDREIDAASLVVEVPLASGSTRRLPLRWNATEVRFEGRLRRARVAPGPVVVVLEHQRQRYRSDVSVLLAPAIDVRVDVRRPSPPSAVVEVHAPHPVVEVRGKHKYRRRGRGKHRMRGKYRVRGHGRGGRLDIRIR